MAGWLADGQACPDPTDAAHMDMYKTIAISEGTYYGPGDAELAKTDLTSPVEPELAEKQVGLRGFGPSDSVMKFASGGRIPNIYGDADPSYPYARNAPVMLVLLDTPEEMPQLT